jgi:hypothetical protein
MLNGYMLFGGDYFFYLHAFPENGGSRFIRIAINYLARLHGIITQMT